MNETRHAHNSYLQVFAEGGVSTGIPMLIALGLLISYAVRAAKGPGVWLAVATLAFLLHNLMDFTLFIEATGIGFACVAGLLVGLVLKPAGSEVTRSGPARLGLYALCFTLALFAFLVGRADALREEARDLVVARRWDEALEAGRAAVRRNPWDPAARSLLSHLYFDLSATGLPDALVNAEREGDAAARLDPHTPHHWSHLSHIRLTRGDIQGAYLAAARATELYPIEIRYREERDAIAGALQARHEDRP